MMGLTFREIPWEAGRVMRFATVDVGADDGVGRFTLNECLSG